MDRPWLVLAGALLLAGCTVDIPGIEVGGDSSGGSDGSGSGSGTGSTSDPAGGKLSSNGLALDTNALALLDPTALGRWQSATEAVADSGSLDGLLSHPAGAEHLEYLALCALAEGTTLSAGDRDYQGLYGLGTGWVAAGCDESCQRWISACLLAHANAYGIAVTISLRGAHAELGWDETIAAEFDLQEAAFYGNVFEVSGDIFAHQPLYACSGRALIAFDEDPEHHQSSLEYLQERVCGAATCGLNHTGPCVFPPVDTESVCRQDAGWDGYYANCAGEKLLDPLAVVPLYPEVITTYLVEE